MGKSELCRKCGQEPKASGRRWCRGCLRAAEQASRRKRGTQTAQTDAQTDAETQTALADAAEAEVAAEEAAAGVEWHCDRCKRPRPAEPFEPPLDAKGQRMYFTDPAGWAPGHGPGSENLCCRYGTCFDVRPGHRVWPTRLEDSTTTDEAIRALMPTLEGLAALRSALKEANHGDG